MKSGTITKRDRPDGIRPNPGGTFRVRGFTARFVPYGMAPVLLFFWFQCHVAFSQAVLRDITPSGATVQPEPAPVKVRSQNFNLRVLTAIGQMPSGGGYSVSAKASAALRKSVYVDDKGMLGLNPVAARPSFCSGAVYHVFLAALKPEVDAIPDAGDRKVFIERLLVKGQPDGSGIWGRWNSNGPCMALLLGNANMGRSAWGLGSAVPGDFIKLWWTEAIGRDETGHSAIFMGRKKTATGEEGIEIWSSNMPDGYGTKTIPLGKIKHCLVSRCEHPGRLRSLASLPDKDEFLASMLKVNTTPGGISRLYGTFLPPPRP